MSAYFSEFLLIADYHKREADIHTKNGKVGVKIVVFFETGYFGPNGYATRQHHLPLTAWGKAAESLATTFGPGDKMLLRCEVGSREYENRFYPEITIRHVQPFDGHLHKIPESEPDVAKKVKEEPKAAEDESDLPF